MINQISIFAENKKGAMNELMAVLAKAGINIVSCVTNDSAEFGIVRLITSDNQSAYNCLMAAGYLCKKTNVLGVEIEDKPGTMSEILDKIRDMNINIDYMYLGFSRETMKPLALIHCESLEIVENTLSNMGYIVH